MQQCLDIVDPWGDDRDDLRAAINTMAVLPTTDGNARQETMAALLRYLKINQHDEIAGPNQVRAFIES